MERVKQGYKKTILRGYKEHRYILYTLLKKEEKNV